MADIPLCLALGLIWWYDINHENTSVNSNVKTFTYNNYLVVCVQDKQQEVKMDDFFISGTGILKKKWELNELKAQLETAKRNVQEAEEEKTSHTQKFEDLKLNHQSVKKTFFSAERKTVKVWYLFSVIRAGHKKICHKFVMSW